MKKASAKKTTSKAASNRKPVAKAKSRLAAKKPTGTSKTKATVKTKPARSAAAKSKAPTKAKTKGKAQPTRAAAIVAPKAKANASAQRSPATKSATPRTASSGLSKAGASATLRQAVPKRSNSPVSRGAGTRPKSAPADTRSTEGLDGALAALKLALEKKAVEPTLLDLRDLCSYTNYRLLLSGRSDRQVDAIADGVVAGLRDAGVRHLSKERTDARAWTLIDFGDFIVDVFHHPSREHYDLESLWNDAPRVAIEVPPDARLGAAEAYA
ncbi:MAG: ribosome silencing factor [Myxococcales bacterium]|nr:ribosome silencing factor [Myxococcales bacterium]